MIPLNLLPSLLVWLLMLSPGNTYYQVNVEDSQLHWTGKAAVGDYQVKGQLKLKEGHLEIEEKQIKGGRFVIDMTSLQSEMPPVTAHLKTKDFFEVKKYPTASFEILSAQPAKGHYEVSGKLRIKNKEQEISFPAQIDFQEDQVQVQAKLAVDRTAFGIKTFMKGDQAIDRFFDLEINLKAKKK